MSEKTIRHAPTSKKPYIPSEKRSDKVFFLVFILITLTESTFEYLDKRMFVYFFKPGAMITLISYYYSKTNNAETNFARKILIALIFCFIGDISLMFQDKNDLYFLIGLSSFAVGHLFYVIAYMDNILNSKFSGGFVNNVLMSLPFGILSGVMYFIIKDNLGDLKYPVIIYISIISVMGIMTAIRISHTTKESF